MLGQEMYIMEEGSVRLSRYNIVLATLVSHHCALVLRWCMQSFCRTSINGTIVNKWL